MEKTHCKIHGEQNIALVCVHIASGFDQIEKIGFFWNDDEGLSRPDAWCAECEKNRDTLSKSSPERWFVKANFKIFCAACWDDARAACK